MNVNLPALVVRSVAALSVVSGVLVPPDACFGQVVNQDFGRQIEQRMESQSLSLFGVAGSLAAPAGPADVIPREQANANQRVKLAKGLSATFVTRAIAADADIDRLLAQ